MVLAVTNVFNVKLTFVHNLNHFSEHKRKNVYLKEMIEWIFRITTDLTRCFVLSPKCSTYQIGIRFWQIFTLCYVYQAVK